MTAPSKAAGSPGSPNPLAAASGVVFGAMARLRGNRALHPRGVAFRATVEQCDERIAGRGDAALVRLSRGGGLPPPLPDVGGLAVRFRPDDADRQLDLLLATSTLLPLPYQVPVPRRRFDRVQLTSIAPFSLDGHRVLLTGTLTGRQLRFEELTDIEPGVVTARITAVGATGGERHALAVVRLGQRLPDLEADRLRFRPFDDLGWLRPTGILHALRPSAYRASRQAAPPPGT